MNENLSQLFYNPKEGLSNVQELYKRSREKGHKYTLKQVREWYKDQPVNQIYKQPQKVQRFNKIQSNNFSVGTFQADLMDLQRFARWNKGYRYLLNIIDIYSRYAWSFPIKSKKPSEIAPFFKQVIDEVKPKKMWFTFDNGNEFKGDVKKLLNEKGAEIHLNDPKSINSKNTVGLIERFNKTLLNKIRKYMTINDTVKYYDAVPDMIDNYNNTVHSTTNKTPYSILKGKQVPLIELHDTDLIKYDYKIGDYVRFQKKNKTFDKKGFIPTFSLNVHQIVGKKGRQYKLDNDKAYYPEQLIPAKKGEDISEIKRKHQAVQQEEKIKKIKQREFDVKDVKKLDELMVEGKRVRKKKTFGDDFVDK